MNTVNYSIILVFNLMWSPSHYLVALSYSRMPLIANLRFRICKLGLLWKRAVYLCVCLECGESVSDLACLAEASWDGHIWMLSIWLGSFQMADSNKFRVWTLKRLPTSKSTMEERTEMRYREKVKEVDAKKKVVRSGRDEILTLSCL